MLTIIEIPTKRNYYFLGYLQCSLKFAQTHSVVFTLSRQINKQKYEKTINRLCAGNKVFVKYQAQGRGLTPTPPCVRP